MPDFAIDLNALINNHVANGATHHECLVVLRNFTNFLSEVVSNEPAVVCHEQQPDVWEIPEMSTEEISISILNLLESDCSR